MNGSNAGESFIALNNLSFLYPFTTKRIFSDFSWRIADREIWSVLGPSGCGKSTLLMLLAGLEFPTSGQLSINGDTLSAPRPRTGLVLQHYGLLPWATVLDNITLGLRIRNFYGPDGKHAPRDERIDKNEIRGQSMYWLQRLGLTSITHAYPGNISGGQRQRTAIARTLSLNPDLLLLDEPFSALDAPTRENLQDLTLELCREQGITVVLVTHDIEQAAYIGQRVLILTNPPISQAVLVDNQHEGASNYRSTSQYHKICQHMRQELSR